MRPWRLASVAVATPQSLLICAAFVLLILDQSNRSWALVIAGTVAALEGLKWAIESEALRRYPGIDVEALYRAAPLEPSHRRIVGFNLTVVPFALVGIFLSLITSLDFSVWEAALFIALLCVPWVVPLSRVWRHNSWLAMTRLPSRPRRSASN
jgi:hypothetical protein